MNRVATVRDRIGTYLELVMFKHTVFALPFALMAAFLAASGVPSTGVIVWIVLAMVGARTSAMAFNRWIDRGFDGANPRTSSRALPEGRVSGAGALTLTLLSAAIFLFACSRLNPTTLFLAPLALFLVLGYSLTKRFTWLSHVWLGTALAFAPFGAWVAVQGSVREYPWVLSLGVLLWVAGFDTIYACQDTIFDRQAGLRSIPARFGVARALLLARVFHGLAFLAFAATGFYESLGWVYAIGLLLAGIALVTQHLMVSADDLTHVQFSFFQMNGAVSLVLFASVWISLGVSV
ncbi:MAG: putative 4-hydroxybenzoate polyprenyltransferase [Thermoanaerobaculia bacterium]|nr:putative 4-hydroxybenzoate polyprenyltransferase [Thermoanaerobaculia bacterium]